MSLILNRLLLACLLLAGLAARVGAEELSTRGVLLDSVAAVVNDGIVLTSALDRQEKVIADRIEQSGQQLPPRNILRQQVLERLVLQELQMQRAQRLGLKISDEMVNNALTEVAQLAGDFNTSGNYVASGLPKFTTLEEAEFVLQPGKEIVEIVPTDDALLLVFQQTESLPFLLIRHIIRHAPVCNRTRTHRIASQMSHI